MKYFTLLLLLFSYSTLAAQPNCEAYKYFGDTLKYEACIKAMERRGHYQFSKEYQTALDESLKIDPTFDFAYKAKSIAYLKSGDFIAWKKLIDKAVEYDPEEHLGYRGWCRYQFFRDYEGAIADIEKLDSLVSYDIGHSQNGRYHLNIAKGLCYRAIDQKEKAMQIIERQLTQNEKENFVGFYDYLHLGVLYLETQQLEKALAAFEKQSEKYELAENQFYCALTLQTLGKSAEALERLEKARALYIRGEKVVDSYSTPVDKVYLKTIEAEIKKLQNGL